MNDVTPEQLDRLQVPFARLLGLRFRAATTELVEAVLEVREELCTAGDILHGGAVMSLADYLGAVATMLNLPEGARGTTTLESKTNFLGASPVGATVVARCTPLHRGRTTQVWQTHLFLADGDVEGRMVAVVTQTQLVLR